MGTLLTVVAVIVAYCVLGFVTAVWMMWINVRSDGDSDPAGIISWAAGWPVVWLLATVFGLGGAVGGAWKKVKNRQGLLVRIGVWLEERERRRQDKKKVENNVSWSDGRTS